MLNSLQPKYILVVGGSMDYSTPFRKLAKDMGLEFTSDERKLVLGEVKLAIFTGGEDVDPSLYGASKHRTTSSSIERDIFEKKVYERLREQDVPMVGICRGAQFLCVMAGGRLVQDITGHGGAMHKITVINVGDKDSVEVMVNSSHHQMQYPFNMNEFDDYEIIGWGSEPRSNHYALDKETTLFASNLDVDNDVILEPDIVLYPKIRALGAQYHPEWLPTDHEGHKLFEQLLDQHIVPMMENDKDRTRAA